jgi:Ca-activated chloride channel family protein
MKRFYALLLIALVAGLLFPTSAHADGVVVINPPLPDRPSYLTVVYHHVEITIEDQVAITKIDQVFRNDNEFTVEGTYLFPLPDEAAIERFVMYVDGKPLEGKVLNRDEARAIYESIVRQNRDPALLEYVGRNCFQASIFPIAPHEEKRIQIEYRQVLPMDQGLVEYVYPLSTERFSPQPVGDVAITVHLNSKDPIKAVYSPSHDVAVTREDDYHATLGYEASNVLPDRDFVLYYTVSTAEFGLNLLTYHPSGEDGFFLLLVAPPVEAGDREVVAKDVIFVLDTSGSMEGDKIDQAKDAALFVLDHLNAEDRFAIVTFNSAVTTYADALRPASERAAARKYVEGIAAGGSTDIDGALRRALELADNASGRPQVVLFLTDGLPTVGEQDTARILENARARGGANVRLFPFGLGYDVNSALLDSLSQENHGASAYILPGENLEERVSAFYSKITSPVLANIALDLGGIVVEDGYPNPLPDLFLGSQLVLVGRYRDGGRTTVTLSGTVNGQARSYVYEGLDFPTEDVRRDFLPRLWATRKIGSLMNEVRLHGENQEVVDEIVALSLRYGIITPYTSFLVDETGRVLSKEGQSEAADAYRAALPSMAPATGAGGFNYSVQAQSLSDSGGAYANVPTAGLRQVADKAFLLANGVWTDTTFQSGSPTTKVTFGSDTYFALLAAHPEWGKYLAVGQHVIVVLDGTAYEVVGEEVAPVTVPPVTARPAEPGVTAYPDVHPTLPAGSATTSPLVVSGVIGGAVITAALLVLGLLLGRRGR